MTQRLDTLKCSSLTGELFEISYQHLFSYLLNAKDSLSYLTNFIKDKANKRNIAIQYADLSKDMLAFTEKKTKRLNKNSKSKLSSTIAKGNYQNKKNLFHDSLKVDTKKMMSTSYNFEKMSLNLSKTKSNKMKNLSVSTDIKQRTMIKWRYAPPFVKKNRENLSFEMTPHQSKALNKIRIFIN